MSKNTSAVVPAKRPGLHDENPLFTRSDWREEISGDDTRLGYWEWVMHKYPPETKLRYLPAEVAALHDPFDLWEMSHSIANMPEAAQFVSVLMALMGGLNEDQRDLIAEKMCISCEALDKVLDLAEKRYEEIIKSVEEHNQ